MDAGHEAFGKKPGAGEAFDLLVILGATASGKTALAVQVARALDAEIISADSRQVYRGMDLGTGKDLAEYAEVPFHLIDIAAPGSEYNVFTFQRDSFAAIENMRKRQKLPLICGGTGMYLDAVLRGYRLLEVAENPVLRDELHPLSDDQLRLRLRTLKPQLHNRTDLEDRARLVRAIEIAIGEATADAPPPPPFCRPLVFGLRWPREELRKRIARRLEQRLEAGMIEEVAQLHEQGLSWQALEFYGLEYRFVAQYLQEQRSRDEMVEALRRAIGKFAKRQETFFRRMTKQGITIHWLDAGDNPLAQLMEVLHYSRR